MPFLPLAMLFLLDKLLKGLQTLARFSTGKVITGNGLNGVGGYKVRVAPAKNAIELVKGDDIKASVPFKWTSGQWTQFRLSVRKSGAGVRITAKAWQGAEEPKEPLLQHDESEKLPPGKAGVWGMPFSGTPIRFDDLKITAAP